MKQRITLEQLEELDKEQKVSLLKWWEPDMGDWVYDLVNFEEAVISGVGLESDVHLVWISGGEDELVLTEKQLPILSMGQMLEIIGNDSRWLHVFVEKADNPNMELCDLLWEETKSALSSKKI